MYKICGSEIIQTKTVYFVSLYFHFFTRFMYLFSVKGWFMVTHLSLSRYVYFRKMQILLNLY